MPRPLCVQRRLAIAASAWASWAVHSAHPPLRRLEHASWLRRNRSAPVTWASQLIVVVSGVRINGLEKYKVLADFRFSFPKIIHGPNTCSVRVFLQSSLASPCNGGCGSSSLWRHYSLSRCSLASAAGAALEVSVLFFLLLMYDRLSSLPLDEFCPILIV